MQFRVTNVFASTAFLKGFINGDLDMINKRIIDISSKFDNDKGAATYYLVRTLLEKDIFFSLDKEIYEELFFTAAYWSSAMETKQKNRPKSFNSVSDKKNERFFTKLTHSIMSALIVKHNISTVDIHKNTINEIKFNLELSLFLNLMFEISCIKRKRQQI